MTVKTCGVIGFFFTVELPPCPELPTDAHQFRCERGHIRDRATCAKHASVLLAAGDLGQTLCRQCYDDGHGEVPIVLVAPDEVTS